MIKRRMKIMLGVLALLIVICCALPGCTISLKPQNPDAAADGIETPAPPTDKSTPTTESPPSQTEDATGSPAGQTAQTDTFGQNAFTPDFVKPGTSLYFNEHEVITYENNPPQPDMPRIDDNYAWATADSGESVLLILLDADNDWQGENYNLLLPKYGYPVVSKLYDYIRIVWTDPNDTDDGIGLSFRIGTDELIVDKHTPKGIADNAGYTVKLALTTTPNNSGGGRYYLPLYAILNEIGGGVLRDPFGDGTDFIYSGGELPNFTGIWETSDRGGDRQDVVIGGETISIAANWQSLELRADGTFLELERYFFENEEWVLTESKGRYALCNRILIMRYETESMYRGTDYTALEPDYIDKPVESWGSVTGAAVHVRYIDEWDGDYFQINGRKPMYADLSKHGEAAPRPGKAE